MASLTFARWVPLESDALDREIERKRARDRSAMALALSTSGYDFEGVVDRCRGECNRILYRDKKTIEGSIKQWSRGYCGSCYVKARRRGEFKEGS